MLRLRLPFKIVRSCIYMKVTRAEIMDDCSVDYFIKWYPWGMYAYPHGTGDASPLFSTIQEAHEWLLAQGSESPWEDLSEEETTVFNTIDYKTLYIELAHAVLESGQGFNHAFSFHLQLAREILKYQKDLKDPERG